MLDGAEEGTGPRIDDYLDFNFVTTVLAHSGPTSLRGLRPLATGLEGDLSGENARSL